MDTKARCSARKTAAALTALVVVALAIALAGATAGLGADDAPGARAIANPPIFESVVAGDGAGLDVATGLAVGADGSLYACGYVRHDVTGDDITVTRFADAPLGWSRTWNGPANTDDEAFDVAVAPDGSVYVLGTEGIGLDGHPLMLKYSAAGDLLWEARRPFGYPSQLALDGAGNAYTCGSEDNSDSGGELVTLQKYTPNGSPGWRRTYQVPGYKTETYPHDFLVTPGGISYVVGSADGVDFVRKAFVVSWTPGGTRRWSRLYNGPGGGNADFTALARCPAGGVYAVGSSRSDADDLLVTRYRATGKRALTRRLGVGDGRRQWAADVAVDGAGRLAVCGGWRRVGRGFYVALLGADGAVRWSHNYAGDRTKGSAKLIAVDASGHVVAIGNGPGSTVGGDYAPGPLKAYSFTTAGALRWSSTWPAPLLPGTADHTLDVWDIATWRSSRVWACGSSDDRATTGPDQLVLGWTLR